MPEIIPENYRVWSWQERGEPNTLRFETRTLPLPAAGQVLIANHAIGLNPVDWKMIEWGHSDWMPGHIPGVDGAGVVVAIGEGVRLPLGLRVAYHQSLARDGSFAELTCASAESVIAVPNAIDDVVAAVLLCPGLTAWQAVQKIPDAQNRDVLITGAGGMVGLLLAQLAVERGWRVWVTAALAHHEMLLALGVTGAFDYKDDTWKDKLLTALGPRRLYVAFDTVSGEHARLLSPLIGYNGHLVCIQDRQETHPLPAFTTAISLHEVALNSIHTHATRVDWCSLRAAAEMLFKEVQMGNLRLSSIQTFPFDKLPLALTALKEGTSKGKLAITL